MSLTPWQAFKGRGIVVSRLHSSIFFHHKFLFTVQLFFFQVPLGMDLTTHSKMTSEGDDGRPGDSEPNILHIKKKGLGCSKVNNTLLFSS